MSSYTPIGVMTSASYAFKYAGDELSRREKEQREKMANSSSDPAVLAEYQAVVAELSLLRSAQSSSVRVLKETTASVVSNFR